MDRRRRSDQAAEPAGASPSAAPGRGAGIACVPGHLVQAGHPVPLGGAVPGQPGRVVRAGPGPGPPPVVRVVHVQGRVHREPVGLVGDRRVDDLQHEHPLARMRRHRHEPVGADAGTIRGPGLGQGHERPTPAVAQGHHRRGTAAAHLLHRGGHVGDTGLVQAVGVVVDVSGGEAQDREPRRGQEWAGVVDAEVAPGVRQHHRRAPRRAGRRGPEDAAHHGAVGSHQRDGLPSGLAGRGVGRIGPVAQPGPGLVAQDGSAQAGRLDGSPS